MQDDEYNGLLCLLFWPARPSMLILATSHAARLFSSQRLPHNTKLLVSTQKPELLRNHILRNQHNLVLDRAVAHDAIEYPSPDTFNPDRFLGPNPALDPRSFLFGVGRRVCAGRDFAEASIFSTASILLATSTVSKARDAQGREIEPEFVTSGSFGK